MQTQGYAHRDIKPQNIFVADDGKLKIGDFGSSKFNNEDVHIAEATIQGSPTYLSPILRQAFINYNQGFNNGSAIHNLYKSDVYSLGITFLNMITLIEPTDLCKTVGLEMAIMQKLSIITNTKIRNLLSLMLKVNENDRPDFIELKAYYLREFNNSPTVNMYVCSICKSHVYQTEKNIEFVCCGSIYHLDCIKQVLNPDKTYKCNYCSVINNVSSSFPQIMKCPSVTCNQYLEILDYSNLVNCGICKLSFCKTCKNRYHQGSSCVQVCLLVRTVKCGYCASLSICERGSYFYKCLSCHILCLSCNKGPYISHKKCCELFKSIQ